jgi:hypothetical protein
VRTREFSGCKYGTLVKDFQITNEGRYLIAMAVELVRIHHENNPRHREEELDELSTYMRQSTQRHLPPSPPPFLS